MIELKLYIRDVDYEALLKLLSSKSSMGMTAAAMAARALPDSAKEELAVKFINASAQKIEQRIEEAAASKGVSVKVSGAQAGVVKA